MTRLLHRPASGVGRRSVPSGGRLATCCCFVDASLGWVLLIAALVSLTVATLSHATKSEINLEYQALDSVPAGRLCRLTAPEVIAPGHWNQVNAVSLAHNQIRRIEASAFNCVAPALRILILSDNQISEISGLAFEQLDSLQVLSLDNNHLETIPSIETLSPLKSLRHLNLANNRIGSLPANSFGPSSASLISLSLQGNPLVSVASESLGQLAKLKTLTLSQTALSGTMPTLNGLGELRFYHLDRQTNLTSARADLCRDSPKLSSLVLKSNRLEQVPQFSNCQSLMQLDLSYNRIAGTLNENFTRQANLIDLYLGHNQLEWLDERAFVGLTRLQVLELNDNRLLVIHARAFLPVAATLQDLIVANNRHLTRLPGAGLERLATLKCHGNRRLRTLPHLPAAQSLALTYAYHCCDYRGSTPPAWSELVAADDAPLIGQLFAAISAKLSRALGWRQADALAPRAASDQLSLANLSELVIWPARQDRPEVRADTELGDGGQRAAAAPRCLPEPNAFFPCDDLFDSWWLRLGIWLVFPLAFAGNIIVIIVLGSVRPSSSASALASLMWLSRTKRHIDVPRFLVINLAIADLMMALYLGILAFVDLSTMGEFRLFAIKWQYSTGCKLAGFLGVLSSELSVFILAIITLERNYAITNAVHLNRRLSLHKAMFIMLLGYAFALAMAVMPLNGIGDYRKLSICLPLNLDHNQPTTTSVANSTITGTSVQTPHADLSAQIYVTTLIGINTFSFVLLLSCYLRIYCAIRGSQAWNTNDLRIAKRMSILVLTDFLCWMPVICVALVSLFGGQLVGSQGLKVLAIFVLPLNSVANPFLYAITTKKFKRDLDTLMRRARSLANFVRCPCCLELDGARASGRRLASQVDKRLKGAQLLVGSAGRRHQQQRRHHEKKKRPHHFRCSVPHYEEAQRRQRLEENDGCCECCCQCRYCGDSKQQAPISTSKCYRQTLGKHQLVTINKTSCSGTNHHNHQEKETNKWPEYTLAANLDEPASFDAQIQPSNCVVGQPSVHIKLEHSTGCAGSDVNTVIAQQCAADKPSKASRCPSPMAGACSHRSASSTQTPAGSALRPSNMSARNLHCGSSALCQHSTTRQSSTSPVAILIERNGDESCYRLAVKRPQKTRAEHPSIRSASACGYRRANVDAYERVRDQKYVSCSCDTMRVSGGDEFENTALDHRFQPDQQAENESSISKLLFKPLAKAWSSIQISLSQTTSVASSLARNQFEDASSDSEMHDADECGGQVEQRNARATTNDNDLMFVSPSQVARHFDFRRNERRMSRSCDYIVSHRQQQQQDYVTGCSPSFGSSYQFANEHTTTTSATTTDDDQRVLLATGKLAAGTSRSSNSNYIRARCTRCRSWSPALLSKLEECIYRVRSRIPGLSSARNEQPSGGRETVRTVNRMASDDDTKSNHNNSNDNNNNNDESMQSGINETPSQISLDLDEYKMDEPATDVGDTDGQRMGPNGQKRRPKWARKRKVMLRQQSSANSDTYSTRTGGTMLTNMSVSFDSNSNIPSGCKNLPSGDSEVETIDEA